MECPPETRFAKSDEGLHVAYQVVGEGTRDIALLSPPHCIDMGWEDPGFVTVASRLGRLGRLILFDWRGFGSSDPVPLGALPTPENWLDDLRVVLDAVGSEGVHLIGGAAAGTLALLFAATYPHRVASVVVVDSYARGVRGDDYPLAAPQSVVDSYVEWYEEAWGSRDFGALDVPSRADDEEYLDWSARARRLTLSPTAAKATMSWSSQLDVRAAMPSVQAPVLVLHSADNPVVRPDAGRYLADHLADSRFVERKGRDLLFVLSPIGSSDVFDHIEEFVTGERPLPDPDRAFATILFTDVVGSTAALVEVGDERWKQVLDRHDRIVDRELAHFRGRKVVATGDGVLAVFDGPARAVRCALSIIDAVRPLGIEVRAGLHAGEVEARSDNIGGIAVHIGQRVSALAAPGEVLVSRTIPDLVAGSGLEFADRGDHQLKGVPGTWQLFSVVG